jgi:GAF domain-containing protein
VAAPPTDENLARWLAAVARIAAAVNQPVSLGELLDLVAETAAGLMGYDFCAVLLPDARRETLLIEGHFGLSATYVGKVNADNPVVLGARATPEAPSSRAFLSGRSVQVVDIADEAFFPWGGVARAQGYRSMVSVPLLVSGEALGTLNCYTRDPHAFEGHELDLLGMLADQAGIAIATARLREREAATIADLRASAEAHDELTAVALGGGGVAGVATALADLLDLPVAVVEEPVGTVLASVDHGGRRAEPGGGRSHGAEVLLGSHVAATIWLPGTAEELGPLRLRAVEQAATVCALELLRSRTALDAEWRVSGEVVADLATGSPLGVATVPERAARLGHDLRRPHALVTGTGDHERLLSVARSLAARAAPRALVTSLGGIVVVLRPAGAENDPESFAEELRRLAARSGEPATVALSPVCRELSDYPTAFRQVRGAAALAATDGAPDRVVTLEGTGVLGLLLQLEDPVELVRFADRVLGPVRHHDRARGGELEATLREYLTHDLSTTAAATALFVHPNTVGQRLRRVEQLLGVSLARTETLAALDVAFTATRVARLATSASAHPAAGTSVGDDLDRR